MDPAAGMSPVPAPPAHERAVALHIAGHAALLAPAVVVVCGLLRGAEAALSAAIGLALVALNLLASASLITWGARRSLVVVQVAVLGGFVLRLAALTAVVLALDRFAFVDLPVLVVTIGVSHLLLLVWETRFVSLTLAAPGLRPAVARPRGET